MSDWRMDGWVKCPGCGSWLDGAAVFGDAPDDGDDLGLKDGTIGECDACGGTIVVHLRLE